MLTLETDDEDDENTLVTGKEDEYRFNLKVKLQEKTILIHTAIERRE